MCYRNTRSPGPFKRGALFAIRLKETLAVLFTTNSCGRSSPSKSVRGISVGWKPGVRIVKGNSASLNHELINQSLSRMPVTPLQRSHTNGEIRRAVLTALKCDPAPSVHEFSESL